MPANHSGIYIEKTISHQAWDMVQMHAHREHELYFLISGKRRYFIEDAIYDVSPGDLVLIPAAHLHKTVATGQDSHARYLIYFDEPRIQPFIDMIGPEAFSRLMGSDCLQLPPDITHQLHHDLTLLEQEHSHPQDFSEAFSFHLLQNILLLALRHGSRKAPVSGESADKIQEITRYITEHYASELSLHDAAAMVFMEATYFSKRFKALTGIGFQEYLTRTRLQAAERLLEETALSIGVIAEYCGFSGSNYFGDVFRKWKGISPSQYRKNIRAIIQQKERLSTR